MRITAHLLKMDYEQLKEDVKKFNKDFGNLLQDKGVRIEAQVTNRPTYGNRVLMTWWLLNSEGNGEDLLYQCLYRLQEGVGWNMTFFLRKMLHEQTFIFSCEHILPSKKDKLPSESSDGAQPCVRNCDTCPDSSAVASASADDEGSKKKKVRFEDEMEEKDPEVSFSFKHSQ